MDESFLPENFELQEDHLDSYLDELVVPAIIQGLKLSSIRAIRNKIHVVNSCLHFGSLNIIPNPNWSIKCREKGNFAFSQ